MPTIRFPVPQIQTLMRSIDARLSADTHIIDGRNFTWDSTGPKSGFGATMLTPFGIERPRDMQAVVIQDQSIVFTQDAVLCWRTEAPFVWEVLYTFPTPLNVNSRFPWQCVFLNGKVWICHPDRGLFCADYVAGQNKFWFEPRTQFDIPGLPARIKGMLVVRGRPIIVDDYTIYWGAVGDLTDLTPELAGAGFQVINGIVAGTFMALTSWQNGFIVWTTEGAVIAEFIDGDEVWRFDPLRSQERPLSPWTTIELSTGMSAMLTNHGLFYAPDAPQPWTPEFNEFFREYVKNRPASQYFFRVDYDRADETVFISESENGVTFQRAFVLKPSIDKWGLFNVETHGLGQWTAEEFGYTRLDGKIFKFDDSLFIEAEPNPVRGLDRHHPRLQKQMAIPSSTLVSRALTYDPTDLGAIGDVARAAWFADSEFNPSPPERGPMDSWVHIGYLRSNDLNMAADAYAEFQEITIHGIPTQPTIEPGFETVYRDEFFYPEIEDWNYVGDVIPSDIIRDRMVLSGGTDWNSGESQTYEDWNAMVNYTTVIDSSVPIEDWNLGGLPVAYGSNSGDYPALDYRLSIHASQDGITVDDYLPTLAKFGTATQEYSTITSGSLHYLRVEATLLNQWYHIKGIDLTMTYGGQQS